MKIYSYGLVLFLSVMAMPIFSMLELNLEAYNRANTQRGKLNLTMPQQEKTKTKKVKIKNEAQSQKELEEKENQIKEKIEIASTINLKKESVTNAHIKWQQQQQYPDTDKDDANFLLTPAKLPIQVTTIDYSERNRQELKNHSVKSVPTTLASALVEDIKNNNMSRIGFFGSTLRQFAPLSYALGGPLTKEIKDEISRSNINKKNIQEWHEFFKTQAGYDLYYAQEIAFHQENEGEYLGVGELAQTPKKPSAQINQRPVFDTPMPSKANPQIVNNNLTQPSVQVSQRLFEDTPRPPQINNQELVQNSPMQPKKQQLKITNNNVTKKPSRLLKHTNITKQT